MKWSLIALLSLLGAGMGVASVSGATRGIEWFLWLVIALISSFVLARQVERKIFLSGFLAGLFDGALGSIIQSLFFGTYMLNNPEAAAKLAADPSPIDPRLFVLAFGPVVGAVYGLVVGTMSVLAGKLMRTKTPAVENQNGV